jgi:hypothetical protein
MAKNPSSTWYFNDWENDPALKACSLAAQGLWKRLLCIAARSPEHGVVQIEGRTSSLPEGLPHIAAVVGRTPEEIAPLIDELLSSGTASRDRKKRIYCRRMVRAVGLSAKRAVSGKLGADATHGKKTGKEDLPRQTPRQTGGPSFFIPPDPLLINHTGTVAVSASASPDGPPRTAASRQRQVGSTPCRASSVGGHSQLATILGPIARQLGPQPADPAGHAARLEAEIPAEMARVRAPA